MTESEYTNTQALTAARIIKAIARDVTPDCHRAAALFDRIAADALQIEAILSSRVDVDDGI